MIVFSIGAMEKAPEKRTGTEPPEFLELAENDPYKVTTPVAYDLTGTLVSGGVLVSGSCSSAISGICGRCLAPVERRIAADDLQLFFELAEGQEQLDVSEDIRAELLLALPMNLLCSGDCKGLCPECGADLNKGKCRCKKKTKPSGGDQRWNALDSLDLK